MNASGQIESFEKASCVSDVRSVASFAVGIRTFATKEEPAKPLELGTQKDVTDVLKKMEELLNVVSAHYLDTQNYFAAGGRLAGSVSLLECIDHGTKSLDERMRRWKNGEFRKGDYDKPDW